MNKFKKLTGLAFVFVLAAAMVVSVAACSAGNGTANVRETCLVQVDGGSGGGYYYKDTNCTVTAEVPEGKQFMKWISGDRDLSANEVYIFTVTEDISLTAVYADAVEAMRICTVNVKNGTGSGLYFADTVHELKVYDEYDNLNFIGWQATTKDADGNEETAILSTERTFMLTVTQDMDITACFENMKLATPDNSGGKHFRIAANGAYEFDREKNADGSAKTVFVNGVDYLLYRMYDSAEAGAEPLLCFKIVPVANPTADGAKAYMTDMDGIIVQDLKGPLGDLYHDEAAGMLQIRTLLKVETGKTYYFDVQAIAVEDSPYIDSEVSVIGAGCKFV